MTRQRILVVEDNPTTRKMLRVALISDGFTVIEAGTGREAIDAHTREPADLILQDLILPDMNGFDLVQRLRALPHGQEIPVLALTGFVGRAEEAKSMEAGFTTLLMKPIEPSRLLEAIRAYLPAEQPRGRARGRDRRMLVVDDDPLQLKLTRLHLEQLGFQVSTAMRCDEALDSARAAMPSAIVCEMLMPDMDGIELCLAARRDPQLTRLPIVLLSRWHAVPADLELAARTGANALLERTHDLTGLAEAIETAIANPIEGPREEPSDRLKLEHAKRTIRGLERQLAVSTGLSRRCALQGAQISMLSGIADALTKRTDADVALRDVLAATLDAAGISKGALSLKGPDGALVLRHAIGFTDAEREGLSTFFGQLPFLQRAIDEQATITLPIAGVQHDAILSGAGVTSMHVVPLISEGHGIGAMLLGAKSSDVTSEDAIAFARAMGNQLSRSLELADAFGKIELSERQSRWLSESNIIGVASWDLKTGLKEANDAFLAIIGYTREDLEAGRIDLAALTPAEYAGLDAAAVAELVDRGRHTPFEKEFIRRDGRRAPVLVGGATWPGFQDRGLSFVLDISDRKRAELEARRHEERFRAMIEKSADGISISDADGICRYVSPAVTRILGLEPAEIIGKNLAREMTHPGQAVGEEVMRRSLERGSGSTSFEVPAVHKDGSTRWLDCTLTNMLDDPAVEGVVANFRDITDRKRSEAQYRVVFDESPNPIWLYDSDTLRILAINNAAVRQYGYSREELLNMNVRELGLAADEESTRAPGRHRTKDGTYIDVEVTVRAMPIEGRSSRLVVAQDVTERNRLEQQLRQAQKMDAIGRLAGGVAHDFNNLLSVILAYSSLLVTEMAPEDPMVTDLIQMKRAAERAADLTKQLLAFSRQQVLEPRIMDLNEVIRGTEKMLRRLIGEDVELSTRLAKRLDKVLVDPGQMEQVIMNLAVNARDAMPSGGKLTIETQIVMLDERYVREHPEAHAGRHVMLAVADTGIGMSKPTLARIFEPFFTTKDKGKGTGLGLATVFGIVRQSGGSIGVYSEEGRGATFKVYLPCADPGAAEVGRKDEIHVADLRGAETILVVEDEEAVREVVRIILKKLGYNVLEASSGGDAIIICEQHPATIHLLLTDVVMPRLSGPQLADRIRPMRPDMRVLFMSGYTDNAIVHHGVLDSDVSFVQKPVTPELLGRRVREVLDAPIRAKA